MTNDNELELTEALYRATQSPHGIVLATSDPTQAIALAYRVRQGLDDSALASLRFAKSPTSPGEVWIVNDATRSNGQLALAPGEPTT